MAEGTTPQGPNPPRAAPLHIPSLDGIRAVSFLIVFLGHSGLKGIVPSYFGLSVFFFLSGYLITTLMRLEFDRTGDLSFKQFYLRRALRILPTFYLVLLVAYLLSAANLWESAPLSLGGALSQFFHVTNYYVIERGWWYGMPPGTWVYWSLAVEEHFYLIFPFLYWWLRKRKLSTQAQALTLLGICAAVLAWRCALVFLLDATRDRTYVATDTRIDSILAGCILAVWRNPVLSQDGPSDRALASVWLPLGVVSVAVSVVIREPHFEQTIRYTLQSFGLLPLFLAAIRWHDRGLFRLLNHRVLTYLGLLSYSMYLLHTSTLWVFEHVTWLPELGRTVLAFGTLVALGTAMHRFVEKPATRLRRRFSS